LLDVHPEPEAASVEINTPAGPSRRVIGPFDRPAIYDNIHAGRSALAKLCEAGLFTRERSVRFEVLFHFESVNAWLAHRELRGTTTEVDPALLDRARQALEATPGELLLREQLRATRYRRKP
jgi:hypothetical protein